MRVVSADTVEPTLGPQGQQLFPCVTTETTGAVGISAGMVVMPPGRFSRPHLHQHNEIVVCCVLGSAVTLVGPRLEPVAHGPGEFIYIPVGVPHVAVNLSRTDVLLAIEMRTDPHFNEDVVLLPELEEAAADAAAAAQAEFTPVDVEATLWDRYREPAADHGAS